MLEEKSTTESKIIIVKDKYPRVFRLNEFPSPLNKKGNKLNSSLTENDTSSQQLKSFNMYFKSNSPKTNLEKNTSQKTNTNHRASQQQTLNQQSPRFSLPLINIKNKIERGEEEQNKNSQIAKQVLSQLKSQRNKYPDFSNGRQEQLKVYSLSEIKKNSESYDSLFHFDRKLLQRKQKRDQKQHEGLYQELSARSNIQEDGRNHEEKFEDTKNSNSSFTSNHQYYFNRGNLSLEVQTPSIFSQLNKDSLLHKKYKENKQVRLLKIQQLNKQIELLQNNRKHS